MTMTRKEFLQTAAGAIAASTVARTAPAAAEKPGPKRGVSVYSYANDLNVTCTLEDCFAEINDLDTRNYDLGMEVLTGVVEDYPNPSDAWVKQWHDMCARYHVRPVEFGHWIDSKLYNEAGPWLSTKESYEQLVQDIKLGSRLGFTHGRTKLGVIDQPGMPEYDTLTPVKELARDHQDGAARGREVQLQDAARDPCAHPSEIERSSMITSISSRRRRPPRGSG